MLGRLAVRGFAQKEEVPKQEKKLKAKNIEKREFKAETKKLLDIVAKSIYTDKEVFLRELMSNSSDALEKQRYNEISGKAELREVPLEISLFTNEKERTITIIDTGIGMTKDEIIDNLGTIARSGSQQFVQALDSDSTTGESIIGQFGVGFYSSFIVADSVEVISKSDSGSTVRWTSDGSGDFEVSEIDGSDIERGTRLTLYLKPECKEFCKPSEVNKILKKYSLFISYPIKLNGEVINSLQAIWYRDRREVTEDEYDKFFESIANTKIPFKYNLHYSTDVPLSIKALLFIPSTNTEKFGMQQEATHLHLYCRKVLIKSKCSELLPHYLRFVKGVVDCEDLPLNISRENYQDSHLISKLRYALTRRIIKLLEDEIKKDEDKYNKWYEEFQNFLKEGLSVDKENNQELIKLVRYKSTKAKNMISLDDYIDSMKAGQKNVYFMVENTPGHENPFLETFNKSEIPVLKVQSHIDEICLRNVEQYKGYKFVNIEARTEDFGTDLDQHEEHDKVKGIPEAEITPFSLWLKSELSPVISKVTVSRRLRQSPAVIVGEISSSMRTMLAMVDQAQFEQTIKNQSVEINPNHFLMVKLNKLRKVDSESASMLLKEVFDKILLQAGIPFDVGSSTKRSYKLIEMLMDYKIGSIDESEPQIVIEDVVDDKKAKQDPILSKDK
jgi:TNF receptor-associated protein 1